MHFCEKEMHGKGALKSLLVYYSRVTIAKIG